MKRTFLKRPGKLETLAKKREEKMRRRILLRRRLPDFSPQWWVERGEMVGIATLFLINFILLFPFFGHEDRVNVFSAPVIPVLAETTSTLAPFSYGVRAWLLVFLVFLPFSLYWMVKVISGRKLTGFLSSLIISLPVGIFLPMRVNLALLSQDGAHVASLTLVPIVCVFLLRFLRSGKFWAGMVSAAGMMLVALTSPLGLVVLLVFMGVITFSEMLLGEGRLKTLRFLTVLILALGFSAFWYNPKMMILTLRSSQGQLVTKTMANLLPVSFFILPVLGVFGFLLFENRPHLQPMFVAFFLTVGLGLFSLGAGVVHHTPSRFLPSLGVSLAFFGGVLIVWLMSFLRVSPKLERFKIPNFLRQRMAVGLLGLVMILLVLTTVFSADNLWELGETKILGLTAEQTVGVWEIREKTGGFENIFGYTITSLTGLGLVVLKRKLERW